MKNRVLKVAPGGAIERRFDGLVVVKGLDEIDLAIHEGERVGLVGHNGSGKKTLLRLLSGIYAPTSGRAAIDGECVSLINIGLGIDPEATGRENIKLRAAMMGMTAKELARDTMKLPSSQGLETFWTCPSVPIPQGCSFGWRSRLQLQSDPKF